MTRTVGLVTMVVLLAVSGLAQAQIKVVKKPAPQVGPDEVVVYTWIASWGLRDDPPDKYTLGIWTKPTESEAVARAKAAIAGTAGNGNLAITHFLIEGEPSVRTKMAVRAQEAKELLDRVKEGKKAVDDAKKVAKGEQSLLKASERKLGDTIKEYKDMVAKSFAQVTEVKNTLTGGVSSLTDANFRQVNGLIDQYNREIADFRSVMGKDADLGFAPLARVQANEPKTVPAEVARKSDLNGTAWEGLASFSDGSGFRFKLRFDSEGAGRFFGWYDDTEVPMAWSDDGSTVSVKVKWSNGLIQRWVLQRNNQELKGVGDTKSGRIQLKIERAIAP
jgi:hypothetical protein